MEERDKISETLNEEELNQVVSAIDMAMAELGVERVNNIEDTSIENLMAFFNTIKEEAAEAVMNCDYYPNKENVVEILKKDTLEIEDLNNLKESNTLCAKLLAEEIKDIDSKELLDKSDDSIYMYLYQRGWILSKRLNPKKIFLYVYINTNLENEILDPETLNKVIPLYLKSNNINLIDIINSWNHPYFLERKHIFNECIWAIENNMYFVAISTLLTQLEGVLYREFGNKVIEDNERGFWNVKRSLNYAFKEEDSSWRKAVHYILENDIYANFGESFLNNKGNSKFKSNTNRNEILHGLNTNYGDESSLVKIVILLDAIHDILKENL